MPTPTDTADREISTTRDLAAPRDLVWKVWTDPHHIARWWGPRGFTTTTSKMDLTPGGVWRFVMHGPDGTDYQNVINYVDVRAPELLVYRHGGEGETRGIQFDVTIRLEAIDATHTRLHMRVVFPTAEARQFVIDKHGALEGQKQHVARLEEYAARQLAEAADAVFTISRTFEAPRELVYAAWTQAERLAKWWGPTGFTVHHSTLDLRPGGTFHYGMSSPTGQAMWGKFVYRDVAPPERLSFVNSFSDEQGNVCPDPFGLGLPLEMYSEVTFLERDGKTTLTLVGYPFSATDAQRKAYSDLRPSMKGGWTGTFEQLTHYLESAK
ncbi:MAG TPA: SRPBCC family protein [Tepidisphaeraceae bacterium]|nr:SRPBCC family protein [Tepidisphaeraceae bacterium]